MCFGFLKFTLHLIDKKNYLKYPFLTNKWFTGNNNYDNECCIFLKKKKFSNIISVDNPQIDENILERMRVDFFLIVCFLMSI